MPNTIPTYPPPPAGLPNMGALVGLAYALPVALLLWALIALTAIIIF